MKCFFSEPPKFEKINIKGHKAFTQDFCFFVDGIPMWVPKGDIIDGASIPWLARFIVGNPFDEDNAKGAAGHDPLYETHALPRDLADECARQLWIQAGKNPNKARLMWTALRSAGWAAWPNSVEEQIILEQTRAMLRLRPDCEKFKTLWFNQYKSLADLKNRCK